MAKKMNKRLRRLQNKQARDAAEIASSVAAIEALPSLLAASEQQVQEKPQKIDATCENVNNSVLVPVPSAFAPSIVQEDCEQEQIQEEQSESIALLRNIWAAMEKKKKRKWTPNPIQLSSWPLLLPTKTTSATTNMIGIAPTGSGKTLAYGIPLLIMSLAKANAGVCGVILVPTRELAIQIERDLKIVATCLTLKQQNQLRIVSVYGGADREDQMAWLCSKKSLLVAATPGRLIDLLQDKRLKKALTNTVRMVVLDEADRMATCSDMAQQVDDILKVIVSPDVARTRLCLYSATYPRSVNKKWNEWVSNPRVCIKIDTAVAKAVSSQQVDDEDDERKKRKRGGGTMELAKIPSHVTQTLQYCIDEDEQVRSLIATLTKIRKDETNARSRRKGLIIVFFNRIKTLQTMAKILSTDHGIKCAQYYGKQEQEVREDALADFKSGKRPTLLATDIAARGIHVNNVQFVINHDFPETLDQYVHRCGRAGRSQKEDSKKPPPKAHVYSFFTSELPPPMANSVLTLLREASNAPWIDPKLLELVAAASAAANPDSNDALPAGKRRRSRLMPR